MKHPQIAQAMLMLPALIVVVAVLMRGFFLNRPEEYPVTELDSGWEITRNGEAADTGTLSQYATGVTHRGETFVLRRTLTERKELPSAGLFFRNLHCVAQVTVDGKECFVTGRDEYESGHMVPRSMCFVSLPQRLEGKTLQISFTVAEEDAFYGLGPVLYGTEQDLFSYVLKERQFAFYVAIFLCIFGVVQLCWLPFLLISDKGNIRLLFSALTTLVLGIYVLGYYNLFDLFTDTPGLNTRLEYLSMYLVTAVVSGYIACLSDGWLKKTYSVFVALDVLFVVTVAVLDALNVVHLIRFLMASRVIIFIETVPFLVSVSSGWHKRRKTYFDRLEENADRSLAVGFVSFVVGATLDIMIFTMTRMTGGQEERVRIPFITVASIIYAFSVSMHYFLHGVVNLRTEATRQRLKDKAFSDPLTGLSNRGACETVLEQLGREHDRFVIISIDMDNLKKVNDTLGHAAGDRMLKEFGAILTEAFAQSTLVGRMGGDEFLVILTGKDCDTAKDRLKTMHVLMEERSRKEEGIAYSASYGMAKNGDGKYGRRAHDVYMLADARMYDMKRRHK